MFYYLGFCSITHANPNSNISSVIWCIISRWNPCSSQCMHNSSRVEWGWSWPLAGCILSLWFVSCAWPSQTHTQSTCPTPLLWPSLPVEGSGLYCARAAVPYNRHVSEYDRARMASSECKHWPVSDLAVTQLSLHSTWVILDSPAQSVNISPGYWLNGTSLCVSHCLISNRLILSDLTGLLLSICSPPEMVGSRFEEILQNKWTTEDLMSAESLGCRPVYTNQYDLFYWTFI